MPSAGGRAGVRFDERAFEQDAGRLSLAGRSAIAQARDEFERDGIPFERLRACPDEHDSGTNLPGCLKVYVPDWHWQWRMIFQISVGDEGAVLVYLLAAGIGHQPRGASARTHTRSLTTGSMVGGRVVDESPRRRR